MSYEEYTVRVDSNGAKEWCQNGKFHRTDGPAIEYANGDKYWYQNGEPHRTDGPACEYPNGDKRWYLEGREVTEAEVTGKCDPEERVIAIEGKEYRLVEVDK